MRRIAWIVTLALAVFVTVASACGSERAADRFEDAGATSPSDDDEDATADGSKTTTEPDTRDRDRDEDTGLDHSDVGTDASTPFPDEAPTRWPEPEEPRVTHDVDRDLSAVLEREKLEGACEAYRNGQTDRTTKMRCGKWMFFYETFGTVGIPTVLLEFLQKHFADTFYGEGFSKMGFVPDPQSDTGMPLGLAETSGKFGDLETRAFTCAACHFGKMPDGRYAVGYGNMRLDYGTFIASLGAPLLMAIDEESDRVHPKIRDMLDEPIQKAKEDGGYRVDAAAVGLKLREQGSGSSTLLDVEAQGRFLKLKKGTMDFLYEPLLDDGAWTVSRILSLWNLPGEQKRRAHDMPSELLSFTGVAKSLQQFLQGFVSIGQADDGKWDRERLAPLRAYIRSLRTPPLETDLDEKQVRAGARLFVEEGCADCHDGPSGESNETYPYEELGVESAMKEMGKEFDNWGDTSGLKAPRLTGLENQTRYLHNGSIDSLEQLFCLEPRPDNPAPAQSSKGHRMTCDDLSTSEKQKLITYLRSL